MFALLRLFQIRPLIRQQHLCTTKLSILYALQVHPVLL